MKEDVLLTDNRNNLPTTAQYGYTALHNAAKEGRLQEVLQLLHQGANPEQGDASEFILTHIDRFFYSVLPHELNSFQHFISLKVVPKSQFLNSRSQFMITYWYLKVLWHSRDYN